jgi:hypothetical protein
MESPFSPCGLDDKSLSLFMLIACEVAPELGA